MGKRVAVVTVYNSPNFGAFLQAYALKSALETMENEVVFVDTHSRNPMWIMFLKMLRKIWKEKMVGRVVAYYSSCARIFMRTAKFFQTCEITEISDCDNVIFGSDEIWNVSRKQIRKYPVFWGKGISVEDKASYAVSINNAAEEDFYKCAAIEEELNKFKVISVRDGHSKAVLEKVLKREDICTVLDPTMLHTKEFYHKLMQPVELDKYILIYSYGNYISDNMKAAIKKYASEKSLRTVSVLEYADWCDYSLVVDPFELLWLFENAEAVFTDTFHGTVFSVIFEKQFKVISESSRKVKEFLELFGVEESVSVTDCDLDKAMENTVQYEMITAILNKEREKSWQVLRHILQDE